MRCFCAIRRYAVYSLCAFAASLSFAQGQDAELMHCVIRPLGIGTADMKLNSPGFASGESLLITDRSFGSPVRYRGLPLLEMYPVDSENVPTGPSFQVPLPEVGQIMLLGVTGPSGSTRFIPFADSHDFPGQKSVLVLNLTGMELYVKLGERVEALPVGRLLRQSFPEDEMQKRLGISIVGKAEGKLVPLINNRLRLLSSRNTMVVITGWDVADGVMLAKDEFAVSVVYYPAMQPPAPAQVQSPLAGAL